MGNIGNIHGEMNVIIPSRNDNIYSNICSPLRFWLIVLYITGQFGDVITYMVKSIDKLGCLPGVKKVKEVED